MSEITIERYKKLIILILVLALIPMLFVAVYARPFADDFGYSARTHQVWQSTHSVIGLIKAVFAEVKEVYFSWQGSFSALALFSLQPSIFASKIYGLSTVILLFFFMLGNYFFFKKVLNSDKNIAVIVFGAVVLLSIENLPHAFQGFYWWNGASYYTLFYSLMLIQWGMLMEGKKTVAPSILGFFLGGGNLVSGLLGIEVIVLLFIREVWIAIKCKDNEKKEEKHRFEGIIRVLVIMIFSAAGFVINVIAPGNAVRALESTYETPLEAVGNSFLEAYRYFNEWVDLPMMLLLLFLLPFVWHYAGKSQQGEINSSPWSKLPLALYALLMFCLFASTFTPTLYSMSEVGPRRVQNIRYYVLIVFLVLLEIEICKRTRNKLNGGVSLISGSESLNSYLIGYMLVILCGIMIVLGINTIPKENRNNLTTLASVRTILIGEAKRYAAARDEWTQILESDEKTVTLTSIFDHPVPIYYVEFDITGNPEDYRDMSMCKYYNKDRIILQTE